MATERNNGFTVVRKGSTIIVKLVDSTLAHTLGMGLRFMPPISCGHQEQTDENLRKLHLLGARIGTAADNLPVKYTKAQKAALAALGLIV